MFQGGSAVENLTYSGAFLDRASDRRPDPRWLRCTWTLPGHS